MAKNIVDKAAYAARCVAANQGVTFKDCHRSVYEDTIRITFKDPYSDYFMCVALSPRDVALTELMMERLVDGVRELMSYYDGTDGTDEPD